MVAVRQFRRDRPPPPEDIDALRWLCLTALFEPDAVTIPPPTFQVSNDIVSYAFRQGLAPLFWRCLVQRDPYDSALALIPPTGEDVAASGGGHNDLSRMLKDSYLSTLRKNMMIRQALGELDDALKGTGIPCIVWKGAAVSETFYPAFGFRAMDDIDLLLPRKHLQPFTRILSYLGYVPRTACPLVWQRGAIVIDIHYDVAHSDRIPGRKNAFSLNADHLLAESEQFPGYRHLFIPCPFDALICLAAHAMKHGVSKDIWIVDMFLILDRCRKTPDFPRRLSQRAKETGTTMPLFLILAHAEQWPWPLPFDLSGTLNVSKGLTVFIRLMTKRKLPLPYEGDLYYLLMMKSFRDVLAFLRDVMFPPGRIMRQIYHDAPAQCYWVYYPLRLARLTINGFKMIIAGFRGRYPE